MLILAFVLAFVPSSEYPVSVDCALCMLAEMVAEAVVLYGFVAVEVVRIIRRKS